MFRPGLYQAPRTTIRHYPLASAVLTVGALAASLAAFTVPRPSTVAPGPAHRVLVAHHRPVIRRTPAPVVNGDSIKIKALLLAEQQSLTYTVRAGDTLSAIARRETGHAGWWPALWWVNRKHLHNPTALLVGQVLALPPAVAPKPWVQHAALAAIPEPAPPKTGTGGGVSAPVSSPPVPPASGGSLQAYAQSLFGGQYSCAASIIERESGWQVTIANPTSGAYGIPQALPGSKMASAGADWATNGETQLRWMKGYVDSVYGGACSAWAHWQAAGSY